MPTRCHGEPTSTKVVARYQLTPLRTAQLGPVALLQDSPLAFSGRAQGIHSQVVDGTMAFTSSAASDGLLPTSQREGGGEHHRFMPWTAS